MRVRVTLSLVVDAKSPSEAAKLLEPVLANVPRVEQFSLTVKGDDYFSPPRKTARNGRRSVPVESY